MSTLPSTFATGLFIGDQYADAHDGQVFQTIAPASGEQLAEVARGGREDVDRAVRAAQAATDGEWGALSLADRARVLRRVAEGIEARVEELAALESADVGKPIRDARAQVLDSARWWDFFADIAQRLRTSVLPVGNGYFAYTMRQPMGVVGAITPWNYPMPLYGVKVPAALAMGNAVVLKPAEQSPLSALALADVCREAGLPAGAFNVVTGFGESAGRALVEHREVSHISFTGSSEVGSDIAARCGSLLKGCTLELGGKSPNIVFADADLDLAAEVALFSFSINQGQLCSAGTRLLVQESVHDAFVEKLVRAAEKLRIGDPSDPQTQLGAVISSTQLERIERYVELAAGAGATRVTGGRRPVVPGLEGGYYYTPTVFTEVTSDMDVAQEEIFGPVLSVLPFRDDAHAVELANDVLFGLVAGIWTRDLARAHRMAAAVDAGIVYVNTMNELAPGAPYSGWKDSGIGVEGGIEAAEGFTRAKTVWMNVDARPPVL